jgi:hypothetical protein
LCILFDTILNGHHVQTFFNTFFTFLEGSGMEMSLLSYLSKIEKSAGLGFKKGKFNIIIKSGGVQQQIKIITIQKVTTINKNTGKHQNK